MNTLAAFDRDRADVTARVSFALSSVLARVALETERCRRALADAEATSYTDEETGNTAENPEAARLRAKLDALEALNERCILAGGALSAAWAQESRQSETHVNDALHRCGVYLKKLNRIALSPAPYFAAETVRNARLSLKRSVKILVFGVIVFSLYHAHAHFCAVGQAAHLPAHVRACAAVIRARNVHHVRACAALFKARAGVFVAVPDAARLDRRKGGLSALCRAAAVQRQYIRKADVLRHANVLGGFGVQCAVHYTDENGRVTVV